MSQPKKPADGNYFCSFCGKEQHEVNRLIAGPGVYICDECVQLCNHILVDDEEKSGPGPEIKSLPKPKEIKATLDEHVIGQEEAKRALSVAVYNHYRRIQYEQKRGPSKAQKKSLVPAPHTVELDKSNILLIGPTGSGKTLLAQSMARILKVPVAIVDATALTEAGYVGEDVENILLRLYQNAEQDVERTQIGIIYIDEIDKIARKGDNPSITRDVSGEGVQQALLKIIEGTVASVPPAGGRKHPHQEFLHINTKNILFICGGAFEGLDEIIRNRVEKTGLGFDASAPSRKKDQIGKYRKQVTPDDLMKYGLIPEFVGRLPIIRALESLDEEALHRVLTEPKNSIIKQYQTVFDLEGVKLTFTDEAINEVARLAIKRETGARGLRSILEEVMIDLMYEIPSMIGVEEVIINEKVITGEEKPRMVSISEGEAKNRKKAKETLNTLGKPADDFLVPPEGKMA